MTSQLANVTGVFNNIKEKRMKTSSKTKIKSTDSRIALLASLKPGMQFNLVRARLEELIMAQVESPDRRRKKLRPVAMEKCRLFWNKVADEYVKSHDVVRELLRAHLDSNLSDELRLAQKAKDAADENYLRLLSDAMEVLAEEIAIENQIQPNGGDHALIC